MTFAIVPAAGQSTRMGRPKLLLPLDGTTVLQRVITTLRGGGVETVLVVLGPDGSPLAPLAGASGAELLPMPETTADMRQTVQQGLTWLEERLRPAPNATWLLCPADHPAFSAETVRQLLATPVDPAAVVIPSYQGRRGHPIRLHWSHSHDIRALPPDAGIDTFVRASLVVELPVEDPGILMNINRPADYEQLIAFATSSPPHDVASKYAN